MPLDNLEKSEAFERCKSDPLNNLDTVRLFSYGFRSGGFVDVAVDKIQALQSRGESTNLESALKALDSMLALRQKPVPSDFTVVEMSETFHQFVTGG